MSYSDTFLAAFCTDTNVTMSFSSSYDIFETQYKCTIDSSEFGYSTNPTLFKNNIGEVYDFATGSYFSPYITAVGLYNDNNDLLAIAKLSQPLSTSPTTDTTILINIDR